VWVQKFFCHKVKIFGAKMKKRRGRFLRTKFSFLHENENRDNAFADLCRRVTAPPDRTEEHTP